MISLEQSADSEDGRSNKKTTERLFLFRAAFLPPVARERACRAARSLIDRPASAAGTTAPCWRAEPSAQAAAAPREPSSTSAALPARAGHGVIVAQPDDALRRSLARVQTFPVASFVRAAPRPTVAVRDEGAAHPSAADAPERPPVREHSDVIAIALSEPAAGAAAAIDPLASTAPAAALRSVAPSVKLSARSPLFRAEALAAYQRGDRLASVLRITDGSRWSLLLMLGGALACASAIALFGRVDEISSARGLLRAPFGLSPVVPLLGGTVQELFVQSGAHVERGDVIARLDGTPLRAALDEATQRLTSVEAQWLRERAQRTERHQQASSILEARLALLERRRQRQEQRVARRRAQVERLTAPELTHVLEASAREESVEVLEGARDETLRTAEELTMLRLQLASAQGELAQQLAEGDARVEELRTQRARAEALLAQTTLRAPSTGKLESLRMQVGQVVQANEWVARIVSEQPPRTMVSFVPDRDAAFLRPGALASVELDQLPLIEFGQLPARVERVGSELADASELARELGDAAPKGPHVRVELRLQAGVALQQARALLRPGALGTARIVLRERRLLSILFEPSRRWFH